MQKLKFLFCKTHILVGNSGTQAVAYFLEHAAEFTMHRKRIIFSSFAVGYVRRLQNLDDCSSSSESEQSFGSSGIYSDESESNFCSNLDSDSETSDQNMEAELRSNCDKPATGVRLHSEADKQATDRSFGLLPRVDAQSVVRRSAARVLLREE